MPEDLAKVVESWRPSSANETFQKAFHAKCLYEEKLLIARSLFEVESRWHNFSSGPPIEALVRDFFRRILPRRYAIECTHIMDTLGNSAGECDIVVHNDMWFPSIRARVADDDRYNIVGIESVYAVLEVKQTLDVPALDSAMEKLVTCARLECSRGSISGTVAENRGMHFPGDSSAGNPLFLGIVATRLGSGTSEEEILTRFVEINKQLKRSEVVRSICILGEWATLWGFRPGNDGANKIATFTADDLSSNIYLGLAAKRTGDSPLSVFSAHLLDSMNMATLEPHTFAEKYGAYRQPALVDESHGFVLPPTT